MPNPRGGNEQNERLLSITIGDETEHDFPDTNGDDTGNGPHSEAQDPIDTRTYGRVAVKITNGLDVAISGRLEATTSSDSWGTDGAEFEDPVTIESFSGLASGDSTYLTLPVDAPLPAVRAVVSADAAPTGGNDVTAEWEKAQGGH